MILFGPAGVPLSCKSRKPEDGVVEVKRLGLDCMEVEFVHGVRMSGEAAIRLRQAAAANQIALTAHGPYYINLSSEEEDKIEASVTRILDTARKAQEFGGQSITFHAAFFQQRDPETVFAMVADKMKEALQTLEKEGVRVAVSPELTGKPSQFGSLSDLIGLAREVPGLRLCIDFSHFVARGAGAGNDYAGFASALSRLQQGLGPSSLQRLHMHASGIEWTAKGERRHLRLHESKFNWQALVQALVDFQVGGIMICESPVMEEDALILKREYLRRKGSNS